MIGSFDRETEFAPRIRIRWLEPVEPDVDWIVTPLVRAVSMSATLVTGALAIELMSMVAVVRPH